MGTPNKVVIRAYQVGFGDCLLLTFEYAADDKRHMLIDFGTVAWPEPKFGNKKIADSIIEQTGGKLSALVITHRHADHIAGLVSQWKRLAGLKPEVVLEPWTEGPKGSPSGNGATGIAASMRGMKQMCGFALGEVQRMREEEAPRAAAALGVLGATGDLELGDKLDACLAQLTGARREFVSKGDKVDLSKELPGVKVTVLGPPPTLRAEGGVSPEFWPMAAAAWSAGASASALFPKATRYKAGKEPPETRWFRRKLLDARGEMLLQMVSLSDNQVNNTSVILLLEVGDKKLLFPGDAEVEGWEEALNDPKLRALLAEVDVYKVGHHGSRNATPKSLWNHFKRQGKELQTVLSSKHTKRWAEVPRDSLMEALEKTKLASTIGSNELFESVELATSD